MHTQFSITEENYIKCIYHLQQNSENVSTNEVAASLQTKPASVTDMLKKLKQKNIVQYEKYKGFKLSIEGKKIALLIVRKHRLWEYFLVEKLALGWDEVHEIAEELEHITSTKLIDRLDAFLEYPKFDPHGDPIPDANGKIVARKQINLIDLPLQTKAEITAVSSQSTTLLEILNHKKIGIGSTVVVTQKFAFDHSLDIQLASEPIINISQQLAQVLFVKTL